MKPKKSTNISVSAFCSPFREHIYKYYNEDAMVFVKKDSTMAKANVPRIAPLWRRADRKPPGHIDRRMNRTGKTPEYCRFLVNV